MKRFSLILAAALIVSTLAGCSGKVEGEAPVQSVSMICGLGSTGLVDRFAGVVSARSETKIEKDENRIVDEIRVEAGDDVKAGQVLFTYDSEAAELDLEKARLELEQLKNTVTAKESEKAQLEKDKANASASEQLSYNLEIQEADTAIREANYNIALKEKEIQKFETALENLEVTSPVDGRVQSLSEEGGTDNYGNQLPFMTIMETGIYRVKGLVNEANVNTVTEGMQVLVRSRVDTGRTWSGTISTIDWENPQQNNSSLYYGTSDAEMTASNRYPFYVELEDASGLLLGQHVFIEPDYGQEAEENANTIHMPAWYINDAEESPWVWAQDDKGFLEKRSVTLGEYDEMMETYVVTGGLTTEDFVAFPDEGLSEGMTCVPYDESAFNDGTGSSDGSTSSDTGGMMTGDVPVEGPVEAVAEEAAG